MLTDTRFHSWSNPKGLMNPAEVVVHVKQGDHGNVVVELLTEGVRQSSEAPHIHPHVEVLAFHVTGADVFRIGGTDDSIASGPKTLRRAVALLPLGIVAEYFDQLRVIDFGSERVRYGCQIHFVAVRGQLNPIRQAAFHVPKKLRRTPGIPPSYQPGNHQLGLRLNCGERPYIPTDSGFHFLGCDVLFLAADERPNLIDLNTLGGNVADNAVLVLGTRIANADQQTENSAFRHTSHANGGTNGAAFDQRRDHRDLLFRADYVCHDPSIRQRFRIVKRKAIKDRSLSGFLHFSPPRFSGFSSASAALLIGHGFQAAFSANLAALGPHLPHDLLNDCELDGLCRFNGFQENTPGILDGIELLGIASPLWHTSSLARSADFVKRPEIQMD